MKRIQAIMLLLFIVVTAYGQNLNGYKYVYVPTLTYQNGGIDIWNISSNLRSYFTKKGFIVLTESSIPPKELGENPCLILECQIDHTNVVTGTNRVTLTLKNCRDEIVIYNTGEAITMSVQEDFNKATKRAFSAIEGIAYRFDPSKTPVIELPAVEKLDETEQSMREYLESNKLDLIEGIYKSYQQEGMPYYKFGIIKNGGKYKAVIIESELVYWKPGEVKAVFEHSSMKGFYSVKWYMGRKTPYETFAEMDNEALLSIELSNAQTGEKTQDKFVKLYPPTEAGITSHELQKTSGSGFFLTSDGIIATNAHVVENAEKITIQVISEFGNFEYSAKVLLRDAQNDVALIKIDDGQFKGMSEIPYSLIGKAEVGEKAFTIGYPLNNIMGTNYKVADGIISSVTGINDDIRYYQISVPLQPGNSGGPLFNSSGNVIGITSARLNSKAVGTEVENVNYAIKISYLVNLYNMLPNAESIKTTDTGTSKSLQDLVKILKDYVCLINVN